MKVTAALNVAEFKVFDLNMSCVLESWVHLFSSHLIFRECVGYNNTIVFIITSKHIKVKTKFHSWKFSCRDRDRDDTFNEKRNTTIFDMKWNEMHSQMNTIQIFEQYILLMSLYIKICARNSTCTRLVFNTLCLCLNRSVYGVRS